MVSLADIKKYQGVKTLNKEFVKREIPDLVPEEKWGKIEHINGRRYYETPSGMLYPSVTSFVKHFADTSYLKEWKERVGEEEAKRITKRSTDRGTSIHLSLEHFIQNKPFDYEKECGEFSFMYDQIRRVLLRDLDSWSYIEHALYSDTLKLAGRCDLMGVFRGRRCIIDYKNKNYVRNRESMRDYFMQTGVYALMHEERYNETIHNLVIIASEEKEKRSDAHVFICSLDSIRSEILYRNRQFLQDCKDWYEFSPLLFL